MVLVTEDVIYSAIVYAWRHFGETIEGSAGAALAAAMMAGSRDRPAVVILSGGNIQPELHADLCCEHGADLYTPGRIEGSG